ncbi:MAG TPA: hypothetical protein VGI39_27165 [Polyangiaceae bacterium]|jgi:hypothetical protein
MKTTISTKKTSHASHATQTGTETAAVTPSNVGTAPEPLPERVDKATVLMKQAIALLALDAPAITANERKGMYRLRKGGEKHIPQLAQIAADWQVTIRTQPTADMLAANAVASALRPFLTLLAGLVQEVQDTVFVSDSESWATASALYAVLKRMSKKDPKLAAQLAPVAEFFAFRRPVADPAAPKPVTNGKESRRKKKEVAAAEALVAEQGGTAAAPVTPVAATPAATTHTGS